MKKVLLIGLVLVILAGYALMAMGSDESHSISDIIGDIGDAFGRSIEEEEQDAEDELQTTNTIKLDFNKIYTIENCPELKHVLYEKATEDEINDFTRAYIGATIKFDCVLLSFSSMRYMEGYHRFYLGSVELEKVGTSFHYNIVNRDIWTPNFNIYEINYVGSAKYIEKNQVYHLTGKLCEGGGSGMIFIHPTTIEYAGMY